jgi:hypothetical protein
MFTIVMFFYHDFLCILIIIVKRGITQCKIISKT